MSIPDVDAPPAPRTIVEACFDSTGHASLRFVYDLASTLGVDDQPVRLAIRRIEAAGLATQEGRGRNGVLVRSGATPRTDPVTAGRLRRALALEDESDPWDGLWRLTAFSLPEGRRADRDALRSGLSRFGGVSIAPALFLSTNDPRPPLRHYAALPDPEVIDQLIVAEVTRIDIAGLDDPSAILARYWDLGPVREAYGAADRALARFAAIDAADDPVRRAADALILSEPFAAALAIDPLLPNALLPADWPPRQVRRRFVEEWSRLTHGAPDLDLYRQYAAETP
ncbi:PaaX family transcriptional regulator C-terminal domain-containing protein [Microbacterium sp. MYb64]|uniref:PaaX family transcriptional regulator C-terminal domain-containing protein n=1 Tax=Microbacterium sp. MYb64 TaxID=1848691 RepID=UPI000CFD12F9|nr:PaaX family transcriptional regulator C-terminal domain-containing protein [Microbacterium sp. MYb64]PRB00961.1 PaaX family transcriptional regulator [Microbacterium sp. MYb64]